MNQKLFNNIFLFGGAIIIIVGLLISIAGFSDTISFVLVSIGIMLEVIQKVLVIFDNKKNELPIVRDLIFASIYMILLLVIWIF